MELTVRAAIVDDPVITKESIYRLEDEMRKHPQFEIDTEHTFGPGFYVRTVRIPAGATLTGKVHSTEHIFMVISGDLTVVTEDGGRQRVGAGYQAVCKPGIKRVGYAHEDSVVSNVHITTETDLVKLEALLIDNSAQLLGESLPKLEGE